jgi:hypothetical protein
VLNGTGLSQHYVYLSLIARGVIGMTMRVRGGLLSHAREFSGESDRAAPPRVPVPRASPEEQRAFVLAVLPAGALRERLISSPHRLARFVAHFRIRQIDPGDADAVERFSRFYEQFCGRRPKPSGEGLLNDFLRHIASEPNAETLRQLATEHSQLFQRLLGGRAGWDFFNLPDRDGFTPLLRAIAESDEDLVEDLIRHGAEVDVDTLNFAIRQSATPGILVILGTGNPDAVCGKARDGANPVRLLAAKGEFESLLALLRLTTQDQMIQVLVDAGANVNAVDDQHRTPLGQAVQSHNYRLTTALLESGANPDQQSYFGIDWLSR